MYLIGAYLLGWKVEELKGWQREMHRENTALE